MKKLSLFITLFVLTFAFFSSCSKNDDTTIPEPETPLLENYMSSFTYIAGGNYEFQQNHKFYYNPEKTVKEIVWDYSSLNQEEFVTYKLSYDTSKRITKIEQYVLGELLEQETTNITYGINGYVSAINTFPVNYDAIARTYTLNRNGSISHYTFNEEYDTTLYSTLMVQFDNQKKGGGYNRIQQDDFMFITRAFLSTELLRPLSIRPVTNISNGTISISFANEYDNDGYLIKSTSTPFNDIYEFTYIKL